MFYYLTAISLLGFVENHSHVGKNFTFGILNNNEKECITILIDIASARNGTAKLTIPYLTIDKQITLTEGLNNIPVDCSLTTMENFTELRSIHLQSEIDISVYATNFNNNTAGTFLVLPNHSTGNRYTAANYEPYSSKAKSFIMIVSEQNQTSVSVFDTHNVSVKNYSLNEMMVGQLARSVDQSGYFVEANKPVAVITGTSCSNVPIGISACDMLVQQVIPHRSLGNIYIVPPLEFIEVYELKVLTTNASEDNMICLHNHTRSMCTKDNLFSGLFRSEPTVVTANLSISVLQYGVGRQHPFSLSSIGDPFMMVIPGLFNYLNQYDFAIPNVYGNCRNLVSVIIIRKHNMGLNLDGNPFSPTKISNVSAPLDQYLVLTADVTTGFHVLKHNDSSVVFGLLVHGHGLNDSAYLGYGYPAGLNLGNFSDDDDADIMTSDVPEKSSTAGIMLSSTTSLFDTNTALTLSTRTDIRATPSLGHIHTSSGADAIKTTPTTFNIQTKPGTDDIQSKLQTDYRKKTPGTGTIIGITAGIISLLAALIIIIIFVKRKDKVKPKPTVTEEESVNSMNSGEAAGDNGR